MRHLIPRGLQLPPLPVPFSLSLPPPAIPCLPSSFPLVYDAYRALTCLIFTSISLPSTCIGSSFTAPA